MASLIEVTRFKAADCPRQVERLAHWLEQFAQEEGRGDSDRCRHLVKLAVHAGLLTRGEALQFYRRSSSLDSVT